MKNKIITELKKEKLKTLKDLKKYYKYDITKDSDDLICSFKTRSYKGYKSNKKYENSRRGRKYNKLY